jgi:chromosome segregation ATPase
MLKTSEDHAKKASVDASRLAEELRQEQDHSSQIEKARRVAETMAKELQTRLDEAEAAAMQGGRKIVQKMEQRIHELEMELESEQQRHGETAKSMRRQERRLKELSAQLEEDRTTHEKMHDIIDKLHQKLKLYKRQIDEAEELANVNMAKYRKLQQEMEGAVERADMAENTLGQLRARNRSASVAPESTSTFGLTDTTFERLRLRTPSRVLRASSEVKF